MTEKSIFDNSMSRRWKNRDYTELDNDFELRDKSSYPKLLNDEINLISFNSEDSVLIGSASYKVQKYPADIDLYQQVKTCCSKEQAIEYFYLGIKSIVNNVRLKKNHWMIEVKCGIDDRYNIIDNLAIISTNDIILFLETSQSIISPSDYIKLKELVEVLKNQNSQEKHGDTIELIYNILRRYKIIRWSSSQIELGEQVRYGKKFYLKDCIDTHSPINIEIIAILNGRFTDISNFYVLMFYDKMTGMDVVVNFPQEYLVDGKKFVIEGLKQGIDKVLFSNIDRDVFKGIKRMFSLARLTNDVNLFRKIRPIISSDLSQLSQLKSELATLHEIIEFTDSLPWFVVYDQLESIKWRLGGNTYLDDTALDIMTSAIEKILDNRRDIVYMKDTILLIKEYLLDIVNDAAHNYLVHVGLYKLFT